MNILNMVWMSQYFQEVELLGFMVTPRLTSEKQWNA